MNSNIYYLTWKYSLVTRGFLHVLRKTPATHNNNKICDNKLLIICKKRFTNHECREKQNDLTWLWHNKLSDIDIDNKNGWPWLIPWKYRVLYDVVVVMSNVAWMAKQEQGGQHWPVVLCAEWVRWWAKFRVFAILAL